MRRIPPYIDCILHYYLMETCGQIACTARTRGTIGGGTGGTIGGQHATPSMEGEIRPKGPFVGPSISAESANEADSALHRHTSFGEDAAHLFHGGYKGAFKSGTHPTTAPTLLNSQM